MPTREGIPTGDANERQMLSAVQGPDTIRTQIRTNNDGSTTRLKTRAGHPEFVTTNPKEPPEEYLPVCAAIPVDTDARIGFYRDTSANPPFVVMGSEYEPASAELTIKSSKVKYEYNQRWVVSASAKRDNLHPGNRHWFDGRTDGRETRHVVSWWCPYLAAQQVTYTWGNDSPWLGDAGVTAHKATRNETGTPLAGTWLSSKGYVFIDGFKRCDFAKHVWAAALDTANHRILAVVTNDIALSATHYGCIDTSHFLLMSYDLVSKTYAVIADLGGGIKAELLFPIPVFRHDAAEVLVAMNIPDNTPASIYRVSASGGTTLYRPVTEDSYPNNGWQKDRVVTMRYDVDDAIKTAREVTFSRILAYDETVFVEVYLEDTLIGRYDQIYYLNTMTNNGYHTREGTLACVLMADGQGGYLVARLPGFKNNRTLTDNNGTVIPSQGELAPGPGPNYTRYRDSDPTTYTWENVNAPVDVPVYFARAGQPTADWAPIDVTHPWCLQQSSGGWFDAPLFTKILVDAYSADGIQLQMQFFLATSVDGRFTIAGGRMPANSLREYAEDILVGGYQWSVYAQQCNAVVIRNKVDVSEPNHVNSLTIDWPGEMATITSPIFYARPYVLKKEGLI